MKYAHYNQETGEILGFYSKNIHEIIPEPAIELTEEEWQNALNCENCAAVKDRALVITPYVAPPEPEPLTAQQKLENAGLTVDELKTLLGI